MGQFFLTQLDYVFFVYGLSFILLSARCYVLRRRNQELWWTLPAAFGLAHYLDEWLDMLAPALPDTFVFYGAGNRRFTEEAS